MEIIYDIFDLNEVERDQIKDGLKVLQDLRKLRTRKKKKSNIDDTNDNS